MGFGACTTKHADDTQTTKRTRQNIHGKTCRRRDVPRRVSTTRWVSRGGFHAVGVIFPHIYNAYVSARQYMPTIHKRQNMPMIHNRQNMHGKTCHDKPCRRRDVPRRVSTTRWVARGGLHAVGGTRGGGDTRWDLHAVGFYAIQLLGIISFIPSVDICFNISFDIDKRFFIADNLIVKS